MSYNPPNYQANGGYGQPQQQYGRPQQAAPYGGYGQQQQQQQYGQPQSQQGGTQPGKRAEVVHDFKGSGYSGEANFDYNAAEKMIHPVSQLTDLIGTSWMIKARVVERGEVKKWNNARGEGILASVTLQDTDTAIRATFFKKGVEKYYDMLEPGKVFYFGNGRVKQAQKRYSTLPCDYEISFGDDATIQPARSDDVTVNQIASEVKTHYTELKDLPGLVERAVNVKGIIREVGDVAQVNTKAGKTLTKRSFRICDPSCDQTFEMVCWDTAATDFQGRVGDGIVSRGTRVGSFRDQINLSAGQMDFRTPETQELMEWWATQGSQKVFEGTGFGAAPSGGVNKNVTRVGLDQVEVQNLGRGQTPEYVHIRGCIQALSDKGSFFYAACPALKDNAVTGRQDTCNKKVTEEGPQGAGGWRCAVHGTCATPNYRYIAQVKVADHTASAYATAFDNTGTVLFGCDARTFQTDQAQIVEAAKETTLYNPCVMTCRVKEEEYEGTRRMKYGITDLQVLREKRDYIADCNKMFKEIQRYHSECR